MIRFNQLKNAVTVSRSKNTINNAYKYTRLHKNGQATFGVANGFLTGANAALGNPILACFSALCAAINMKSFNKAKQANEIVKTLRQPIVDRANAIKAASKATGKNINILK